MPDTHIVLLLILFCDISSGLEEGRIIKSRTTHLISLTHTLAHQERGDHTGRRGKRRECKGGRTQTQHNARIQRGPTYYRWQLLLTTNLYERDYTCGAGAGLSHQQITCNHSPLRLSLSLSLFLVYFLQQESLSSTRVILHSHTLTRSA